MGKDEEIAEVLKVRISVGEDKELIGSGFLYLFGSQQEALILTAAHVVDKICTTENKAQLANFECNTINHGIKTISIPIVKASGSEELLPGYAYVHKAYRGEEGNYSYDAAIIVVNWEFWIEELPSIMCKKFDFQGKKAIGKGFPDSMNNEYEVDAEHAGQKNIKGTLNNFEKGKGIRFSYDGTQNGNYKVSRDELMKGFSGTGLIIEESSGYYFGGVVSHGAGDENTAGTEMWIAPSDFFIDIITDIKVTLPKLEISLDSIEALKLKELPLSDSSIYKLKESMYIGIKYGGWTRKYFESNSKDFDQLHCEESRDSCKKYIDGLLKRAVIFQSLNVPLTHKENYLKPNSLSQQGNEKIFLEYLCTEEPSGGIVFELVENHYFVRDRYLDKATIFIVNGKQKISIAKRKNVRGMMTSIVNDKVNLDLKEFGINQEKISQSEFDIIMGRITDCKMAMVAIDELISCMEGDSTMDEANLKGELNHLWNIN